MWKLAVLGVLAVLLAGCGNKTAYIHEAETEGVYVDLGGLVYQVQMSRFLTPGDVEDDEYLVGLPDGMEPVLPKEEIWFGIWMRVKNYGDETLEPATEFKIVDTEENSYEPVEFDLGINPFAYNPRPIPPGGVLPVPQSAASSGPIQGSLILFRIKNESLQNRPLKLVIEQGGDEAVVDLDL